MSEKLKPEVIDDDALDDAQGGVAKPGAKGLFGDDLGARHGGVKKPQPKGMERVFDDE